MKSHFNFNIFRKENIMSGSKNREYMAWWHAINRCHNPKNKQWNDYGGRGIIVEDFFRASFENFFNYMGVCPEGYSLDRIDNSLGYCIGNLRWADKVTQMNNMRSNRLEGLDGVFKTIAEWSRQYNVTSENIRARLRLGWTLKQALGLEQAPDRNRNGNRLPPPPRPDDQMKRFLTCNGETKALRTWGRELKINSAILRCRLDRLGWTVEQALGFDKSPSERMLPTITYNSETKTIQEWATQRNIEVGVLRWRLKNWTLAEALGFEEHTKLNPVKNKGPAQTLTYEGVTRTYNEWAEKVNITYGCLLQRIKKGWPLDEALGFKIHVTKLK